MDAASPAPHTTIKTDYNDKESSFSPIVRAQSARHAVSLGTELGSPPESTRISQVRSTLRERHAAFTFIVIVLAANTGPQTTHATPPSSSSSSSPSFTQSTSLTSASSPSTSPPLPTTPPRPSRPRTRYPGLGRVPLHRRGTSKTYERLEDLLREAGYKETRVFTPEGERPEAGPGRQERDHQHQQGQGGVRNSVGAFVGFLAGLMPAASRSTSSLGTTANADADADADAYSPPASPLAQNDLRTAHEPGAAPHLPALEPTPRANRRQPPSPSRTRTPVPAFPLHPPSQSQSKSQKSAHRPSSRRPTAPVHPPRIPPASTSHPHRDPDAAPSRAGAYLRHIASAPNMAAAAAARRSGDAGPPLPPSWLQTVARAVLAGGVGAYIGGPPAHDAARSPTPRANAKTLRAARSSLSQASPRRGLSDATNTNANASARKGAPAPPELFARIERGRAGTCAGAVSRTRVVCRSAPASRAASPVRGGGGGGGGAAAAAAARAHVHRGKRDRERRTKARVPSLASTRTEGDVWCAGAGDAQSRYLGGWGWGEGCDERGCSSEYEEEEEEEEGELDLARMLVNPRRQGSIVSLRRHLSVSEEGAGGVGRARVVSAGAGAGAGSVRGSVRRAAVGGEEGEEEEEGFVGFWGGRGGGSGRSAAGSARLGIPGTWGLIGGGG
ncbi:hypothetical protein C0993_008696 [Termitomyces sp. T159_Od127]|nr:hypothetical protein C0993_008696 [Termitomyces sp. T159_Od127]